MDVALRAPRMTREEFFGWAQAQAVRHEFDGVNPVAMTGGMVNHNQITLNAQAALRERLRGSHRRSLGPDAGVATTRAAVRYPDALITCTKTPGDAYLVPGVIVVFEVLSPASGRMDRIVRVREYAAVPSLLRYVILEYTTVAATVLERAAGDQRWVVTTLTDSDILRIPEVEIEFPLTDLYADTDVPREEPTDTPGTAS